MTEWRAKGGSFDPSATVLVADLLSGQRFQQVPHVDRFAVLDGFVQVQLQVPRQIEGHRELVNGVGCVGMVLPAKRYPNVFDAKFLEQVLLGDGHPRPGS